MWSLGSLSLDDELEPACAALSHFALGDLEVRLVLNFQTYVSLPVRLSIFDVVSRV